MPTSILDRLAPSKTAWIVVRHQEPERWGITERDTFAPGAAQARPYRLRDPGTGFRLATDADHRGFADALRRIQQHSGLDWGQIARTIGVSRRTLYNWLGGSKVSGVNAQRLTAFYNALTDELAVTARDEAREHLLAPSGAGPSPLARISVYLRDSYPHRPPVLRANNLLAAPALGDQAPDTGDLDDVIPVVYPDREPTEDS